MSASEIMSIYAFLRELDGRLRFEKASSGGSADFWSAASSGCSFEEYDL
jgi:hypothetical protein